MCSLCLYIYIYIYAVMYSFIYFKKSLGTYLEFMFFWGAISYLLIELSYTIFIFNSLSMKVTLFNLHPHLFEYDLHVALFLLRMVEVLKSMYI